MFMGSKSTACGSRRQPNSVGYFNYRMRMNPRDSKKVLWDNVSRLMVARYGKENLTRLSQDAKIGPGTCTRIKEQKTSVGTDVIESVAKALKVDPWQLLVAGLDPSALPVLNGSPGRAEEPAAAYTAVPYPAALQSLRNALVLMTPAARESAATLLASMARNPEAQWVDWLSDLIRTELSQNDKTNRGPGLPPSVSSDSAPTMVQRDGAMGAKLKMAFDAAEGEDESKPGGIQEQRSGRDT